MERTELEAVLAAGAKAAAHPARRVAMASFIVTVFTILDRKLCGSTDVRSMGSLLIEDRMAYPARILENSTLPLVDGFESNVIENSE
jgi:hypothetical protein